MPPRVEVRGGGRQVEDDAAHRGADVGPLHHTWVRAQAVPAARTQFRPIWSPLAGGGHHRDREPQVLGLFHRHGRSCARSRAPARHPRMRPRLQHAHGAAGRRHVPGPEHGRAEIDHDGAARAVRVQTAPQGLAAGCEAIRPAVGVEGIGLQTLGEPVDQPVLVERLNGCLSKRSGKRTVCDTVSAITQAPRERSVCAAFVPGAFVFLL